MWKKLGVICISLLATFSVVYSIEQYINASSVSGNGTIPLVRGNKVYVGNFKDKDISWDILADGLADNYVLASSSSLDYVSKCSADTTPTDALRHCYYSNLSPLYLYTENFKKTAFSSMEEAILTPYKNDIAFVPTSGDMTINGYLGIQLGINVTLPGYWIPGNPDYQDPGYYLTDNLMYMGLMYDARITEIDNNETHTNTIEKWDVATYIHRSWGGDGKGNYGSIYYRPFTLVNKATVVFGMDATATGMTNAVAKSSGAGDGTATGALKLRIKDTTKRVDVTTKNYGHVQSGSKVPVEYSNASLGSNQVLSAIITNSSGEFVYYRQGESVNASSGIVDVDITGLPIGDYAIQFVNEEVSNDYRPVKSSLISSGKVQFKVVDPIRKFSYEETPQPNGSTQMDHLEAGKNVDKVQVAKIVAKDKNDIVSSLNLTYEIYPSNSGLEIKKDSNGRPIVDADGNIIIYAASNLTQGIYKFRVQAFDAYNFPKSSDGLSGIDKNGNPVTEFTHGLISDELELIVYPSESTIKFEPTYKIVDGINKNWNTSEINDVADKVIGTGKLDPNPKGGDNPIFDSTMQIKYAIKDVKLNGTSISVGQEDFKIDEDTGEITKKNTILYGKHEFTLQVNYTKDGKTVTIDKKLCAFTIEPILYFVDEKTETNKIKEVTIKHDESATDHRFLVLAKSDTTAITDSPNLMYRIDPSDSSGKIKYIQKINKKAQFETAKPGITFIEAYYVENGIEVVVERLKIIVSVDAISELTFTITPQNNSANKAMDHLSHKNNTMRDDIIGKIASKGGTKPITYNLSDTENFTLKNNPDTATQATQKYITDADGNVLVYAKKDLEIGMYPLKIQAYDDLGQPVFSDDNGNTTYGIDSDGNKVTGYDKGLISDSYEVVVYPNDTQATLTQEKKNSGTAKEQYFTETDIKGDLTVILGSIDFTSDAKIEALKNAGYIIQEVKLVNKGTSTQLTELKVEQNSSNKNKYNIKANNSITAGTKEFDIVITFKKASETSISATITKANQTLYIAKELKFLNPDKQSEFLSSQSYSRMYEPDSSKGNNVIKLLASEKVGTINTSIKYCILKDDACDSAVSSILTLTQSNGEAEAIALPTGTSKKEIRVRAYLEDSDGVLLTTQDLMINILPAKQTLQWEGANIQVANNNITKDGNTPATWMLNLKFDESTNPVAPSLNTYTLVSAYAKTTLQDGDIMIRSNVLENNTTPAPILDFKYTITYDLQKDKGKIDEAELANGKLVILGELEGNASITATALATGDYAGTINEDDPNTSFVEELGSATLRLTITSKPKVNFKTAYTTASIINGDAYAKGTNSLGTISLNTSDTTYEYNIQGATILDEKATSDAKKLDPLAEDIYVTYPKDNFIIKMNSADTLMDQLYVNKNRIINGLPAGTYQVTVAGSTTVNGVKLEAVPKIITIIVGAQNIDYEKLEWQSKDSSTTSSFQPVNGIIAKDANTNEISNTVPLTVTYKGADNNGNPGYFYVNLADTDALTLTGVTIKYGISDDSSSGIISFQTPDDAEHGKVSMHGVSSAASILKIKATIQKQGYADMDIILPIVVQKATPEMKFVKADAKPYPLINNNNPVLYKNLDITYSEDALIDVFTANANIESDLTLSIKSTTTSTGNDVLKFKSDEALANDDKDNPKTCIIKKEDYVSQRLSKCQPFIEHAMDKISDKGTIIFTASTIATANYNAFEISMPINVDKANQDDFDFSTSDINVESNEAGAIVPNFLEHVEGKDTLKIGNGKITLLLASADGTPPDFTSDEVFFDVDEFDRDDANYSDGYKTYLYNIVVDKNASERVVHVYARKEGDRNYKASAEQELAIHILPEDTSLFRTKVESYPESGKPPIQNVITYGDAYFSIKASSPDDDVDEKATYTYTFDDKYKDYLETYVANGESNEFKPLKVNDEIIINVTRTSGTGAVITSTAKIKIQKKVVKLKVSDVSKKNGQLVSAKDDYKFTNTSTKFLDKDKNDIVITFQCQDDKAVEVDTFSDGIRLKHNQLPIKATIENKSDSNDVLSNYAIKHLDGKTDKAEDGMLIVTEEESQKTWYEIKEGSIVNDKGETILTSKGQNNWYNGSVDVILKPIAGDFDLISKDEDAKDWSTTKFSLHTNGANATKIYFRKSNGDDKDFISKPQQETIKIDTIAPKIKDINATLTHTDNFSKFINTISFGAFMKPGEKVSIKTEDVQANKLIEVSTTSNVLDGLQYKVYTIDDNGSRIDEYKSTTTVNTDSTGTYIFDLEDPGTYEVCAIVKDQAGNTSDETCKKLLVKKIDFDGDDDGTLDYLDPDGDGCPDIDIVLTDKDGKRYKINVDLNGDGIPDLNIDSDGDGIADINEDTDKDNKPDLNLVKLTKDTWKPTFCVTGQSDEYCTTKGLKPQINVDVDGDQIPDINIDNIGDFKPHLNISKDGKTPSVNIVKLHDWKPSQDYKENQFPYDSIGKGKDDPFATIDIDSDGDGRPDLNVDVDGDGTPDINIDSNYDGIPELNIDGDGDGKPDYNLEAGDDGIPTKNIITVIEWKPGLDGKINGKDFDTMEIKLKNELEDNGIKIEKPGGSFLPNYSIKVSDVTDSIDKDIKDSMNSKVGTDQEIKNIYDVNLWEDNTQIQPDGTIRVKVPYDGTVKNPKVIIEIADGTFKEVDARIEDGFLVYETDYLGKIGVIGDKEVVDDTKTPSTDNGNNEKPSVDTSVKGTYTNNPIGGALTGDSTNLSLYTLCIFISALGALLIYKKRKTYK